MTEPALNPAVNLQLVRDEKPSLWRRAIYAIKRSHWIFRLNDFVLLRLQMQDGQRRDIDALSTNMAELARQHVELSQRVAAIQHRLLHHEKGPLKTSKETLDRRRGDGILGLEAREHTPKRTPAKHIDASGQVVGPPPPAEAASEIEDDEDASA